MRDEKWPRGVRRFLYRMSSQESFYPAVADDFEFWADEWMAGRCGPIAKEFLDRANQADIVLYNGENSIYRNTPEGCHGVFLLWLTKTRLHKPCGIINHTAHLNDVRPILFGMVHKVFPLIDLVAVREPCSLRMLQSMGVMNAELYPDAAFSQNPNDYPADRVNNWLRANGLTEQSYFCLSASGLPVSMPRGRWDGEITHLVRDLKSLGHQAVLVAKDPWCLPLAEAARRTGSLFFGPENEYYDLWHLFSRSSFLVSGHYHYVIFAAMSGCPFIPLSVNNHKMQGVCDHLEWHRTDPFDSTSLQSCRSQIVDEACLLLEKRSEFSDRLTAVSSMLREDTRRLGDRIASISGSKTHNQTRQFFNE
ncbi:polysaccharide pyruvyl transferase family protein [bacterium]|nr:polysaccharide pyruvyl transferase family protein [candidate division CSSED10-310 bacterium]